MSLKLVLNDKNGRFGNKLFQVAASIATAKKNNMECFTNVGIPNEHIFKNKLLSFSDEIPQEVYVQQQWNYYDIKIDRSVDFRGYYQSEKYFYNIRDEIKNLYQIKEEIINQALLIKQNINDCCGIHVRRSDYISPSGYFNLIPIEYYKKAINLCSCKEFCIFSDDIDWCKDIFNFNNFTFISSNDFLEFTLLSLCKEVITCNSTFGWWAAYLNKNSDKKIIAPSYDKWFGPNYSNLNNCDIYPESWIQINYES